MSFYKQDSGWARQKNYVLDGRVEILRVGPCLACGDPTGNCTSESHKAAPVKRETTKTDPRTHYVESDVWIDRQVTPTHSESVKVASEGTWITEDQAIKLGLA